MSEALPYLGNHRSIIGTNTTLTLPDLAYEDGDFLVLVVMHRDTLTTPSGWTLDTTVGPVGGDANNQRVSILHRTMSGGGTLSQSVTQGSSQRLGLAVLRFRGVAGFAVRGDLAAAAGKDVSVAVVTSAKGTGRLVIWAIAQPTWATDDPFTMMPWLSTEGLPTVQWGGLSTNNQPRLGVFIDDRASAARTFSLPFSAAGTTTYTLAALELEGPTIGGGEPVDPKRFLNVGGEAVPIQ